MNKLVEPSFEAIEDWCLDNKVEHDEFKMLKQHIKHFVTDLSIASMREEKRDPQGTAAITLLFRKLEEL